MRMTSSDPYVQTCKGLARAFDASAARHGRTPEQVKALTDRRLVAWHGYARMLVSDLTVLRPPAMMTYPATLPNSEIIIWESVRAMAKNGARADKTKIEIATDFLHWREQMTRFEHKCRGKLRCAIDAVYYTEQIPDESARLLTKQIRDYVKQVFQLDMPDMIPDSHGEREDYCRKMTTYLEDFPMWMRGMTRPKGCYPSDATTQDNDDKESNE